MAVWAGSQEWGTNSGVREEWRREGSGTVYNHVYMQYRRSKPYRRSMYTGDRCIPADCDFQQDRMEHLVDRMSTWSIRWRTTTAHSGFEGRKRAR
jgi:hypothetical protein